MATQQIAATATYEKDEQQYAQNQHDQPPPITKECQYG